MRAQLAANRLAGERLAELIGRRGKETVLAAFDDVIAYAEARARAAIRDLPDGDYRALGARGGRGDRWRCADRGTCDDLR